MAADSSADRVSLHLSAYGLRMVQWPLAKPFVISLKKWPSPQPRHTLHAKATWPPADSSAEGRRTGEEGSPRGHQQPCHPSDAVPAHYRQRHLYPARRALLQTTRRIATLPRLQRTVGQGPQKSGI